MTGSAANVVLDILFISVLGMGIRGAAWGTVVSGLINLMLISPYFLRGKSQCRPARLQGDIGAILKENLKHGFGFNVFFIVVNAFMLLGNALVLKVAGHDGLTLFDVCLQIQSATFSVVIGLCMAGISHINYLRAAGDINGQLRIMRNTSTIVVGFYGVLLVLLMVAPQFFLWCFGLDGSINPVLAPRGALQQCRGAQVQSAEVSRHLAHRVGRRFPDDHQRLRPPLRPDSQRYGCHIIRRPFCHLPLHVRHECNNYGMG